MTDMAIWRAYEASTIRASIVSDESIRLLKAGDSDAFVLACEAWGKESSRSQRLWMAFLRRAVIGRRPGVRIAPWLVGALP